MDTRVAGQGCMHRQALASREGERPGLGEVWEAPRAAEGGDAYTSMATGHIYNVLTFLEKPAGS